MKKIFILNLILLIVFQALGQNKKIIGFVNDQESRVPLSNVTIRSKVLNKAIGATNRQGYFEVQAAPNDVLTFQALGYSPVTESVETKTTLSIVMRQNAQEIEEIVVKQGYTERSRETLTGSSISISGKDIQDVPVANITELLQGKVAGVNIQMNNGTPGGRGSIFVRGLSNISSSGSGADAFLTPTSPLFVIDGVPVDDNTNYEYGFSSGGTGISPLSLIPPEDIETIDFLKDAAATSIYGSRGAYGVILITTKRGKSKVPIIQYQTNFFANTVPMLKATLGGREERLLRMWQIYNFDENYFSGRDKIFDNPILSDSLNPYYNNSTNWQSVFIRPTYNQTHNMSASGGDNKFNYKINGSYYNEAGIIKNTGFNRYAMSMNTEYRPSDKFRMFTSMAATLGEQKTGGGNSMSQAGVAAASSASSLLPSPSKSVISGDIISSLDSRDDNKQINMRASLDLDYQVIPGLRLINGFSYNLITDRTDSYTPAIAKNNTSSFYNYDGQRNTFNNLARISYLKELGEHTVSAYGFNELIMNTFKAKAQLKGGFANDQIEGPSIGLANALGGVLNNASDLRSAGFGAAFTYNYANKYIFDATFRMDKSSTVGPDVPWVKNPSLAARWNIDREPLMEDLEWLDYLALRGSWGRNIVPTGTVFDANGKYIYTGRFNNDQTIGFDWGQMPNANLKPSTTMQMSGAIEMGILNNRITTIQEVYYKQVDNQLWEKTLPDHNAFGKIKSNNVSLVNYGYEFTFRFRPLSNDVQDWNWTVDLNGAINNDILTSLPDNEREEIKYDVNNDLHTLYRLGRNSLSHMLYHYRGTFANTSDIPVNPATGEPLKMVVNGISHFFQTGDPFWTDVNGDYIIDERDLLAVGNSQPRVFGGFSTFLQYKGFTLNVNMSYIYKRDIMNNVRAGQLNSYGNPLMSSNNGQYGSQLLPLDGLSYYQNEGDVSDLPLPYGFLRQGTIKPFRYNQTLFMEDGSYLKINTITLGYNIPRDRTQKYGITSMRFYGTVNNLHTFSNYSGSNPESVTDMGHDRTDGYPMRRSFTIGMNVQF